jgi:hypothetical protein
VQIDQGYDALAAAIAAGTALSSLYGNITQVLPRLPDSVRPTKGRTIMNALILMAVYVAGVAVFESVAVGIGFVTDVIWPTWSMIIFLGTTAAAI